MRERVVLVTLVVLLLAGGATWWFTQRDRTPYEEALATLPEQTLRAAYTDWSQVRSAVDETDLEAFGRAAYDRGLSRTSALESTLLSIDQYYGINLHDAAWEIYGQSEMGSVAVVRVADTTSYDGLRDTLADLGYGAPASDMAAWTGDADLVTSIDPTLTPVMHNVLLLEDERLVVLSDEASYAESTAEVAAGSTDSMLDHVDGLADHVEDPAAAILWAEDYACEALTMATADESDQAVAQRLVDEAGGVSPLTGLLMAAGASDDVRVVMEFEDAAQADDNLQPRTDLASGESPGLGGAFPDRFTVTRGSTDDRYVVLDLEPAADQDALLSTISDGPVLFATC